MTQKQWLKKHIDDLKAKNWPDIKEAIDKLEEVYNTMDGEGPEMPPDDSNPPTPPPPPPGPRP